MTKLQEIDLWSSWKSWRPVVEGVWTKSGNSLRRAQLQGGTLGQSDPKVRYPTGSLRGIQSLNHTSKTWYRLSCPDSTTVEQLQRLEGLTHLRCFACVPISVLPSPKQLIATTLPFSTAPAFSCLYKFLAIYMPFSQSSDGRPKEGIRRAKKSCEGVHNGIPREHLNKDSQRWSSGTSPQHVVHARWPVIRFVNSPRYASQNIIFIISLDKASRMCNVAKFDWDGRNEQICSFDKIDNDWTWLWLESCIWVLQQKCSNQKWLGLGCRTLLISTTTYFQTQTGLAPWANVQTIPPRLGRWHSICSVNFSVDSDYQDYYSFSRESL